MNAIPDTAEFEDIDRHFAKFIAGFGEGEAATVAAMLSRNLRLGHICLDAGSIPPAWRQSLAANHAIGGPDENRPLVLDTAGRIYLRRYWEYEQSLAAQILKRCDGSAFAHSTEDLQQLAIDTALARRFSVISGGPGTGKTTTVLEILARLRGEPGGEKLRIALAAPTGKAAARLQESAGLEASTLHRLLGSRDGSVQFRHNAENLLPLDVIVVDEASMVPLTIMAKLFNALPDAARVILLGDRDQLASVEPGAVLGDIAEAAALPASPLHGSMVVLSRNYRFGNDSNIFSLCNAVRNGDVSRAIATLTGGNHPDLAARHVPTLATLSDELRPRILAGYGPCLRATDPAEALDHFKKFRLLCALRSGPFGVEPLNRRIEAILREEGLAEHLPILITRNDYPLRLFNGDIGIIMRSPDGGPPLAWFSGEDGSLRHIPPARLPAHEPAFAMTVHKSQGSEFENVLLLLPDKESPVLTRELIYTGLTRARAKVELWYNEATLRTAITQRTARHTGLKDILSGL